MSQDWRRAVPPAVAGLITRLLMIAWTTPLTLSLVEGRFWDLAQTRMAGTAFLPPLAPWCLMVARALFGDSIIAARIGIACLSAVSIVLVYVLAQRHLGAGRFAAWVAALMPTLVYYDTRLLSEPLVILALLSFGVLWSLPKSRRAWAVPGAGLSLGLAALARPEFLLLPIILLGLGAVRGRWPVPREVAILGAGIALLIAPWILRNHREVGAWIIVSSNGGYNFWKSFNETTDGSQVPPLEYSVWDKVPEKEADVFGYREGWRFIRSHPLHSLALAPLKVGNLLGPERDYLHDLKRTAFPARIRAVDAAFALLQNAAWFLLMALGSLALVGPRGSAVKDVVVAVPLTLVLVHLVFFGDDRFHVPMIPFLCIALPEFWLERRTLVRSPAALALALLLLVVALFWCVILLRDMGKIEELWRRL